MEDVEDVDDIEEDELLRWRLFLGMNIRSSGAPAWPPVRLAQGPDRLCCGKVGGLATAVMRDEQPDQAGRLSGDSRASVQAEFFSGLVYVVVGVLQAEKVVSLTRPWQV